MTEERFILDDDGIVTDMLDLSMYIDNEDCCEKLNELAEENQRLKNDCSILVQSNQEYRKEKKQLKQELKEFKDYVFSDEEILCYSCVNCISKGIYEVECSEKGQVDVHSACFLYWKNEVIE